MAANEHPLQALAAFLPDGTFEKVADYLHKHKVHLTLTRERKSVLGDYRNAIPGKNHRITVNQNLNKYSFLITLLHELAHLLTFEQYGHRVMSHGKEWKAIYSSLLATFVQHNVFPADITHALRHSISNPAASSCAEEGLMRVLRKYDPKKENVHLLEELPANALFATTDGRVFKKGERLRKRYRCQEVKTGLVYLFSPVYEVRIVEGKVEESVMQIPPKHKPQKEGTRLLEQLPANALFAIADGRVFEKGERLRTRYKCKEVKTGLLYSFSARYVVRVVDR